MNNKILTSKILALTIFLLFTLFIWQGSVGFSLWDEGYLWYGAQRVLFGEVPIRDFMAYDPGRYYWSASVMNILGDNGIMTLRAAVAIFQGLGLFVGLFLIARSLRKQDSLYLLISAITLVAWMFPRHKLFDISLSILLIGVLAFLIQNPTNRRFFIVGVCLGIVAVFGRNHGVYGLAGSVGVVLWLRINQRAGVQLFKGLGFWATGIVVGYSPVLFMAIFVPNFASSFYESILIILGRGATNLALPIPWPWLVNFSSGPSDAAIRQLLIGLFFVGIPVFGGLSLIWLVQQKLNNREVSPVLVAAVILVFPYAHYAYSRADISHLAQGIFPFLVGCLAFLATQSYRIKLPLALTLCFSSLWLMFGFHPGGKCFISNRCVTVEVSNTNLLVDPKTKDDIGLLRELKNIYANNGQSFIVTPFWPGAYPLLDQESPMWAIYALWARGDSFESKEIERIRNAEPSFVLINDFALDGRDELRFQNTHPLIYEFILEHFEQVSYPTDQDYRIYILK